MTNGCPGDVGDGVCRVPLDFFNEYQNCAGPDPVHPHVHAPIQIAVGDYLLITNANGSSIREKFSVGQFTEYTNSSGDDCDESGPKNLPAEPFSEPLIGSLQDSHNLRAMKEGCYKVNLTLNQKDPHHKGSFCTIDPHIIIKGSGGLMIIKRLEDEIGHLENELQEVKKELEQLEKEQEKDSKHQEKK
jgi:hypothetical protein